MLGFKLQADPVFRLDAKVQHVGVQLVRQERLKDRGRNMLELDGDLGDAAIELLPERK
jgi:hypothetical protein